MAGWNIFMGSGWLVAAAGLVMVLVFLSGRRLLVRRVPRCIACGYRLEGTPATEGIVRCPECGRVPLGPGEPYALGRKRWIGLLGAVLVLGGWVVAGVPVVRSQGWAALLPIGIQARLLGFSDDPNLWDRVASRAVERGDAAVEDGLRLRVVERLRDADGDPAPAIRAMTVLGGRRYRSEPFRLSSEELWLILEEGAPAARAFAMEQLGVEPPTEELVALRRLAWADADIAQRKVLIDWLVQHPAGPEDLDLIRAAISQGDFGVAMGIGQQLAKSPPEVAEAIAELFEHPEPRVRFMALFCFAQWLRDRDEQPPIDLQRRILALAVDPDPDARSRAASMIEDMSPELVEPAGELLLAASDEDVVERLIHAITRKDEAAFIPYLERAALQPHRPLVQRFFLAEAHQNVRARTRETPGPERFGPLYEDVADALAAGETRLVLAIGQELNWGPHPLLLLAIADRAEADGVGAAGLTKWLEARPPFAALVRAASPGAVIEGAALTGLLRNVSARDANPETLDRIAAHVARWVPDPEDEASN